MRKVCIRVEEQSKHCKTKSYSVVVCFFFPKRNGMKTVIRLNCSIPDYCIQRDETKNAFPFSLSWAIYACKPLDKELIFKEAHFCALSAIQQSSHAALTFPSPKSIRPLQIFWDPSKFNNTRKSFQGLIVDVQGFWHHVLLACVDVTNRQNLHTGLEKVPFRQNRCYPSSSPQLRLEMYHNWPHFFRKELVLKKSA